MTDKPENPFVTATDFWRIACLQAWAAFLFLAVMELIDR